jgi:hypothetical protein
VLGFGFLALCRISPLGATVAVITCVIRCLFRCDSLRYMTAMLLHDSVIAIWHRIFGPPRVRVASDYLANSAEGTSRGNNM